MFKRRDRRPLWKALLQALWPRGGWGRAARYVQHRLHRLPDPPEKIARGIFAGVFTTFTPFYGLHFFIAAGLAWIMRGNIVAALLGTFFGNPLTYVPIGVVAMKTGHWMLGLDHPEGVHRSIGRKFVEAGRDLTDNFYAIFTDKTANWQDLSIFYYEVFWPYLVGGIVPGIVTALICYYVSVPLIRVYQKRRRGAIMAKLAVLKKKKKQADGGASSD